jgi:dephospho-CoA kinase
MVRIGLTGGIASGKSTVAQLLSTLGAFRIDADAIARQVTASKGAAIEPIRNTLGQADGSLNRERMRELVFSNPDARNVLQSIVHPLVAERTQEQSRQALAQGFQCLVYDVPLLAESAHWRWQVDKILVIDCDADVQIERSHRRSGLDRAATENIVASQATRLERLGVADLVICNSHLSMDDLTSKVRQLAPTFGL